MYRLLLCGITLLLLGLTACNEPAQDSADSAPGVKADRPVADAGDSSAPAGKPARDPGGPAAASLELTGEWFALFGRTERGAAQLSWDDGHRLLFEADGSGSVLLFAKGEQTEMLPFQWQIDRNQVMMTYYQAQGGIANLLSSAPLGLALDEEIGLMGSHIDEEIGLMSGHGDEEIGLTGGHIDEEIGLTNQGKEAGFKPLLKVLEVSADGSFLAVRDQFNHLMVYARVLDDQAVEGSFELTGEWIGSIGELSNVPADISWDGKQFTAAYELDGGSFSGTFMQGYFVGKIEGGQTPAFAALRPTSESDLNGASCSAPYAKWAPEFDFMRK